ncbi:MAG: YqjK-like family protein [Methylotenera sp.]|nr:YqjK-like family protein [Methylotenera sp.]
MNKKLLKLAQRRKRLIAESANQRVVLAQIADTMHKPLGVVDQGLGVLRYVQNHPIWLTGGSAALLAILRPRHIRKWLSRGWVTWRIAHKLRRKFLA